MKKILLLGLCLACLNSYAQLDLKFNSDGVLQDFSNTYTKDIKSVHGAYPSILLNTNTVNFSIKYPTEKSLIPNKLINLSTNLSDSKFTDDPIFRMIFPIQTNIDIFRRGIPTSGASFYEPNPDSRFPFKAATKSYYEFLNNTGVQITSVSGVTESATGIPIKDVSSFKIKRKQFDNQIIVNHLNSLKKGNGFYNGEWEQYKPLLNEISKANENWGKEIELNDFLSNGNFNISAVKYLDSLNAGRKNFEVLLEKVINDNREWIKSWLWFTEGKIKLNPFDVTDPTPQILIVEEDIKLAEEKIKLLNAYAQNRSTSTDENFRLFEADLERITSGVVILKKQKEELLSLKNKYNIWLNSIKQSSFILYDGALPLSDINQINWIQHFNANKKFEFLNKPSGLPHSIAERDQIIVLAHNLGKDKDVNLTSTEKLIDLEPPIVVELNPFIDALTSAFALIPNVTKVASVLRPLFNKGIQTKIELTNENNGRDFISTNKNRNNNNPIWEGTKSRDNEAANEVFTEIKEDTTFLKRLDKDIVYKKIIILAEGGKLKQADSLLRIISEKGANLKYIAEKDCETFINKKDLVNNVINEGVLDFDNAKQAIVKQISNIQNKEDYFILSSLILGCEDTPAYKKAIENYKEFKVKLKWLSEQTTPVTEIEFNKEPYTFYRTKVLFPEKELVLEKTKEVSLELFPSDTPEKAILKKTYKKHELPIVWPMGGIALIPETRSTVVYDNATKAFKNDTKISNIEGFVGVKIFPWRTNITYKQKSTDLTNFGDDTNLKRGNSFLNRVSFTVALGVSHSFAKNYLLGINIDPTPGIGINVGINTFLKKGYSLENGVVVDEFTRFSKPYIYYGVNIDPAIFNKIIKLFN
ncbi:hypothetical protein [Emticicia soli]|uniref:Uncharacterized protein n=1 Tax=Emticicia soli TaxID=2027878 RepID=A0ABW5JBZ4_9BACT